MENSNQSILGSIFTFSFPIIPSTHMLMKKVVESLTIPFITNGGTESAGMIGRALAVF
ncbi:hypothetical protein [Bacillus timonensis]|uniref:hypothetical protein n=1 Tax=Bacillus timonensis TaxID=1033734 RepID=UPI00030AD23B|nr:hypothetical protein [Bacillus timonensis]